MKGKINSGRGVIGVSIDFRMNELVILHDLCDRILREQNIKYNDSVITLAKIISKIPNEVLGLADTFGEMTSESNIFKSNVQPIADTSWNDETEDMERHSLDD